MEAPVLNLRLRRRVNEGAKIYSFGYNMDLGYPSINLGSDLRDLRAIVEGKHSFSKILLKSSNPLVVLGAGVFQRIDFIGFIPLLNSLFECTGARFSVLQLNSSRINSSELNLINLGGMDFLPYKGMFKGLVYIIDADNVIINKHPHNLIVYQGHHGDRIANLADVILPGVTPVEKNGIFFNLEGKLQSSKFVFAPPGNARSDWKIIKALSDVLGIGLEVSTYADVHIFLKKYVTLKNYTSGVNSMFFPINMMSKLNYNSMSSNIEDFYMNDSICRASYVMSLCSNRFNKNWNYKIV